MRTKYRRKSSVRVKDIVGTCEDSSRPLNKKLAASQAALLLQEEACKICFKI
jgi:hypothetical protein